MNDTSIITFGLGLTLFIIAMIHGHLTTRELEKKDFRILDLEQYIYELEAFKQANDDRGDRQMILEFKNGILNTDYITAIVESEIEQDEYVVYFAADGFEKLKIDKPTYLILKENMIKEKNNQN